MGLRRRPTENNESMLQDLGMGYAADYQDATSEVYDQPHVPRGRVVHTGPDGQLGEYVDGQYVGPLTPDEAMRIVNFQPTEIPDLPDTTDGFTITQDLPSRGRISARISVDFDAHGNPALLPDARDLGAAMLASAGNLAQQGGTQIRYEGYGDDADGQQADPQTRAAEQYYQATDFQGVNNSAPQNNGYDYGATNGAQDYPPQLPPGEQLNWDDDSAEGDRQLTKRQQRRWEKEQAALNKDAEKVQKAHEAANKVADKAAAREIAKHMAGNPLKIARLGVAAVIFCSGYNALTGNLSTEPVKLVGAFASTPWHVGEDLLWAGTSVPKILRLIG